MDTAARVALDKAFELATKTPGQPWSEERIVTAARQFEQFLTEPNLGESLVDRVEALEAAIMALEVRIGALEIPKPAKTKTRSTQPDLAPVEF